MAIAIPIITEFSGKGIAKAKKEFAQLEGVGAKAGFILKKSMIPATAAVGAIGVAAFQAGEALLGMASSAAADQKAQKQLALSIRSATKATATQIAGVENFIDVTQRAVGVADDELRPAFARLVRSTKDLDKAQQLLKLSLDVSAATGKPLEAVANALGKAYDGQNTALGKLGLGIDKTALKGMDFAEVQDLLNKRFGGAAAAAAGTFEGKMARLRIRFDELQESIGEKVLPLLEPLIDAAMRISDAFGVKGAAGAVQQLRYELKTLYEAGNPLGKFLEKTYNGFAAFYNLLGSILLPIRAIVQALGGNFEPVKFDKLPKFQEFIQNATPVIPPGQTTGPMGPQGSVTSSSFGRPVAQQQPITINVTSGDPRATVDALVRYQRQNGAIPIAVTG